MSTLLNYLKLPNNKSLLWWIKYYWNHFLEAAYEKKVSNNIDNSWKNIKISHTITPKGWSEKNAFEFLSKEYDGIIMKRFMDKTIKN